MKSRGGKSQSREEKKKEDQRRERVRRKKMQVREKVEKSRNTVFFQWSVTLEARKVGSRVRSHLARWEMKNCTPLRREAHFRCQKAQSTPASEHFWKLRYRKSGRRCGAKHISDVKKHKAHQLRSTFWSWDIEKVDAAAALGTFRCQKAQSTPASEHFWKLRYRKSGHRCEAKHISDVKKHKAHQLRTTFGSWDVEIVDAAVAQSTFPKSKSTKHTSFGALWKLRYRKSGRRCGAKHISEVKKHKAHQLRSTFWSWDVEKVHAVVSRSIFPKSKSTKHTSFGALFEVEMSNKCTLSCREAHFKVKMCKTYHSQSTFGSWAIEKVHAVVARTHFKVEMYKTP